MPSAAPVRTGRRAAAAAVRGRGCYVGVKGAAGDHPGVRAGRARRVGGGVLDAADGRGGCARGGWGGWWCVVQGMEWGEGGGGGRRRRSPKSQSYAEAAGGGPGKGEESADEAAAGFPESACLRIPAGGGAGRGDAADRSRTEADICCTMRQPSFGGGGGGRRGRESAEEEDKRYGGGGVSREPMQAEAFSSPASVGRDVVVGWLMLAVISALGRMLVVREEPDGGVRTGEGGAVGRGGPGVMSAAESGPAPV
ncbi:glycine-rich cell wall structural protein 1.8-like [Penaeus monodon]|uniref:glycine-rich cell wall structural protein 1.8-like n=1 Tax=Penaeus monodon TaxID=6687 RepID=UPI0018A751A6|nr:glycine-rich cell wall structural protein 1.8-like [Penaeus monodon]